MRFFHYLLYIGGEGGPPSPPDTWSRYPADFDQIPDFHVSLPMWLSVSSMSKPYVELGEVNVLIPEAIVPSWHLQAQSKSQIVFSRLVTAL